MTTSFLKAFYYNKKCSVFIQVLEILLQTPELTSAMKKIIGVVAVVLLTALSPVVEMDHRATTSCSTPRYPRLTNVHIEEVSIMQEGERNG